MINNAYLVLSVKEFGQLYRAAKANQKALGKDATHCIVLEGLQVIDMPNGDHQISSVSFDNAYRSIL